MLLALEIFLFLYRLNFFMNFSDEWKTIFVNLFSVWSIDWLRLLILRQRISHLLVISLVLSNSFNWFLNEFRTLSGSDSSSSAFKEAGVDPTKGIPDLSLSCPGGILLSSLRSKRFSKCGMSSIRLISEISYASHSTLNLLIESFSFYLISSV